MGLRLIDSLGDWSERVSLREMFRDERERERERERQVCIILITS